MRNSFEFISVRFHDLKVLNICDIKKCKKKKNYIDKRR